LASELKKKSGGLKKAAGREGVGALVASLIDENVMMKKKARRGLAHNSGSRQAKSPVSGENEKKKNLHRRTQGKGVETGEGVFC